jgi:hypothetical protein
MTPEDAARALRRAIRAPAGTVSVWAWRSNEGAFSMVVRIEPRANIDIAQIPPNFDGYPVRIEPRDSAVAAQTN